MSLRGSLHADAGVWAGVVIEGDEAGYTLQRIMVRLEALLAVDHLRLEDAVNTLRNSVISGLVVLRHADFDAVLLQFVRIGITAVLYASVRVMDESFQLICRSLRDGHLVRIGIRHQVQVTAVVNQVDVRDVAYPELIGACGHEAADEVHSGPYCALFFSLILYEYNNVTWIC